MIARGPSSAAGTAPGTTAVPLALPMGYVLLGLVSFGALAAGLLWFAPVLSFQEASPFDPRVLLLVHLFTLGWGSAITLGVLHQMAPVLAAAPLASPRAGFFSLGLYSAGVPLLVAGFGRFSPPYLLAGGLLIVAGCTVFFWNLGLTLSRSSTQGVTRTFVLAAATSFAVTLVAGLGLAASLAGAGSFGPELAGVSRRVLGAHLLAGGAGWFTGIVMGVSYRLLEMFLLTRGHGERAARYIFVLLYGGAAAGAALPVPGAGLGGAWAAWGALTAAALFYAADLARLWWGRTRLPDVPLRQVPLAIAYLLGSLLLAGWSLARAGEQPPGAPPAGLLLAIGVLFALGWVSTMILAFLHKIVPFLVWYHRFSPRVGRGPVPLMRELVSQRLALGGFALYHAGVVGLAGGLVTGSGAAVQGGAASLAGGFAVLAGNLLRAMLRR